MSRQIEQLKIGDREIIVKELIVKEVKSLWKDLTTPPETGQGLFSNDFLRKNWEMCVSGITLDELDELTPTDVRKIYDTFEKVNHVFFAFARQVQGESAALHAIRQGILLDLSARFAGSLNADMPEPGSTDTASS